MYIGRIVGVARTEAGALSVFYRVSSRSFPNRTAVAGDEVVSIVPKPGHEGDVRKNPYIAYNCVRIVCDGAVAVATNGGQTDPIAEKISMGMPVRDALALVHLALDYEKDQYDTPRISAVVDTEDDTAWLATIRNDGIEVRCVELEPGQYQYVATYEENSISDGQRGEFPAETPADGCAFVLNQGVFAERTNPVTGVCAMASGADFLLHALDVS